MVETIKLKLVNGSKINVKKYGSEYFGEYGGQRVDAPIYEFKALEWLIDQMNDYTEHHFDQVILITGDERCGKSNLTWTLAKMLDPNFDGKNFTFTQEAFRNACKTAKKRDIRVMDEGGAAMFAQEWQKRGQKELVKAFQVFGKKELRTFLVLPHRNLLNYQLRNRRVHWWIHVHAKGTRRGFLQLRHAIHSKWKTDAFWEPVFAAHFPKFSGPEWDEYEIRKDKFIDDQLAGRNEETTDGEPTTQTVNRVHTAIRKVHEDGKGVKELAKMFGYSKSYIYDILSRDEPSSE